MYTGSCPRTYELPQWTEMTARRRGGDIPMPWEFTKRALYLYTLARTQSCVPLCCFQPLSSRLATDKTKTRENYRSSRKSKKSASYSTRIRVFQQPRSPLLCVSLQSRTLQTTALQCTLICCNPVGCELVNFSASFIIFNYTRVDMCSHVPLKLVCRDEADVSQGSVCTR